MKKTPVAIHWSGGKDSALALYRVLQNPRFEVRFLATTVFEESGRVAMHGLRISLLEQQARSLGLPLRLIPLPDMPDGKTYDSILHDVYKGWTAEGIRQVVFGDIFLEDLRIYREKQLAKAGLKAIFPLWGMNTQDLLHEFWQRGFRTIMICTQERLADFTGKILDMELVKNLPEETDVCGENGEFHTFVFNGPLFQYPVLFSKGELTERSFSSPAGSSGAGFTGEKITFVYLDLY